MALYACDEDDLIFAADAEKRKTYWCLECFLPVKVRKGRDRLSHFYHLQASPRCRLYSKGEDHLIAQLQLQKLFLPGAIQIERPFPAIGRVADLCWEAKKIIFEIQCSSISQVEAEGRIRDYQSSGYSVVWLLDDRRYNRRVLRPEEPFLRAHSGYYLSLQQGLYSDYYDQFEIFAYQRRVKKGRPMKIDLQRPYNLPVSLKSEPDPDLPQQVLDCIAHQTTYFPGDRIQVALRSYSHPQLSLLLAHWRAQEIHFAQRADEPALWKEPFFRWIGGPYLVLLDRLLRKLSR